MKNISLYIKGMTKKELIQYSILVIIFCYHLIGIFPITRFETDSIAIANACEEMIQSGKFEENVLGHSYHMQSGTYFLIVTVAKTSGLSAFSSYSILTIIFAFIYWIFLFLLLRKITNAKPVLIIIILFLFQEIFILSYYANSAVIASAFWIAAFYILWTKNDNFSLIISALLLSLAMWFRVDAAFTFPSVFILLYMKNKNLKSAFLKSIILAVIVIPITLLLMQLMNANVAGFLGYTQYHGELFGTDLNIGIFDLFVIKAHAAYFTVLLVFMISFGLYTLFREKKIIPVLFLISGILFYYFLGINNAIAPKHLSYYTLFWCVVILSGLNSFNKFNPFTEKVLVPFSIFLFVIQYIIGIRIDIGSVPYQFDKYSTLNPFPTIFSMGSINHNKASIKNAEFVIGTGTKISTPDELSASSGLLFSPVMWYKQKEGLYESFNKLSFILNHDVNDTLILNVSDGSTQFVINNLLTNGYKWEEKQIDFSSDIHHLTFIKTGSPIIKVTRHSVNKDNFEEFLMSFANVKSSNHYFVFIWDWQNYYTQEMSLPFIKNITYHIHKLK
ncbi:MAG: hypothetical protein R6W68_05800 [Ignavibacteriaceae bacterium]